MAESGPSTQTFFPTDEVEKTTLRLFSPGRQLANRYVIRHVIDWGGSAVVYAAYDRDLRREIALKVLRPDRVTDDALTRFRREVAVARDAASPRLVRIFDIVTSDGAVYLTMELIAGASLRKKLIDTPRLPIDEVTRLASAIAEGLDALHTLGIVHRDVKPGNVLLDEEGELKLADFGLARYVESESVHATSAGAIVGTLAYLSPEQALGVGVDHRSDLYSLGVVMFEMLTGASPFESASELGALLARMKSAPIDVRPLRRDCPRWLARLVRRLLERNPTDRYPSAAAVLNDLLRQKTTSVRKHALRPILIMAGLLAMTAASLFGVSVWRERHEFSHSVHNADGAFAGVSRSGDILWSLAGYHSDFPLRHVVLENGHGGRREIAVILRRPGDLRMRPNHTMSFLDPQTGAVTRTVVLPNASTLFRYLPARYDIGSLFAFDLDDDGYEEILATFVQIPEWPSYTVLYEPQIGRARVVFAGTGHHHPAGVADVDGDGRKDLIFQGIHNAYGWYNTAAAVSIYPPVGDVRRTSATAYTPDIIAAGEQDGSPLLWFTYLPRGYHTEGVLVIPRGNAIHIDYPMGRRISLGMDGLPTGTDDRKRRAVSQMEVFARLRDTDRLIGAGSVQDAMTRVDEALRLAKVTGNPLLTEAVEIRRGRVMVRSGRMAEAEAHYDRIAIGEAAPEIALEAAEELHLAGEVEKALRWYRRGLAFGSRGGRGRSRHEFIEGYVFAAAELGRWDEGFAETARFQLTYVLNVQDWTAYYREFLRWRSGGIPDVGGVELPSSAIDVLRYWELEFAYANGAPPAALLLRIAPDLEERSPARSAILSLHAELLYRTGRTREARAMIVQAVRTAETDREMTTIARAHFTLVRERYETIMENR